MKCSAKFAFCLFVTANWVSLTNCYTCSSLFTVSIIFAKKFVTSSGLLFSELKFRVLKTNSFFSRSVKESAVRTVLNFWNFGVKFCSRGKFRSQMIAWYVKIQLQFTLSRINILLSISLIYLRKVENHSRRKVSLSSGICLFPFAIIGLSVRWISKQLIN